jgi:hypothetical protein
MSVLDVIVLIPVLPVVRVLANWAFSSKPWNPLIKVPKIVVGPYVLYLSFVAWYGDFHWWFVLLLASGATLLLMGVEERTRK